MAMAAMAATDTARGRLSPATVMDMAMAMAVTDTAMAAMAAMDTARGRPSPATAMDMAMAMAAMAVTVTATATATATTDEHHHRRHLNLQAYKSPCICDQLRVLNYARNQKKYCSFRSQVHFRTLV